MAVTARLTAGTANAVATETQPRMRIMVLGLRGVIDVQGGIETHARRLSPLLALAALTTRATSAADALGGASL